jgi:hypothetical protein
VFGASFDAMTTSLRSLVGPLGGRAIVALAVLAVCLTLAPAAGAQAQIYWWNMNMPADKVAYWPYPANHNYNELAFGFNAGWRSEVWEVTPAGYRHFDKWCVGNCFNAHPPYYYTKTYCSNRDGREHFVYDCKGEF